jgi:hypothetical protein
MKSVDRAGRKSASYDLWVGFWSSWLVWREFMRCLLLLLSSSLKRELVVVVVWVWSVVV